MKAPVGILHLISLVAIAASYRTSHAFTVPITTTHHRQYAPVFNKQQPLHVCGRSTKTVQLFLSSDPEEYLKTSSPELEKANAPVEAPSQAKSTEDVTAIVKSYASDVRNIDTSIIKANILDGEWGERGEALAALALLLVVSVLWGGLPVSFLNSLFGFLGGPGLFLGGAGIILASINDLSSDNLTPFSKPVSQGTLVQDGIYGKVRHPMYTGLIALMTGFSIVTGSATRLVFTAFLILLLDLKSNREEEFLMERYPDYEAYKSTVTGKFLPGEWFK